MRITFLLLAIVYNFPIFAQWEPVSSPVSGLNFELNFINDSVGFCAGNDGVIKTTDYGDTWSVVNSAPSGSNLFFINETIGYLISRNNNELYKSIDSGNTWQLNTNFPNETPEGVFFTSMDTGYLITSIYGPPGGSFIYKTTNGGINWSQTNSFPDIPTLQAISFTNNNTGFIVGYSGKIIKTNNAGIDWDVSQVPNTGTLFSVCFPDQMTGFAVGYSNILGSDVIKTIDGGNSWQNLSSGGTFNNALRSVYFSTVNNGYAAGENGRIIRTDDGGDTWSTSDSGVLYDLHSIFFTSNIGFAAGDAGTIVRTTTSTSSNTLIEYQKSLKVYPIPAHNQLKIESDVVITEITIIDFTGKVVKTITGGLGELNIANLPTGIYFLKIMTEEGIRTTKFVKL